MGIRLQRPLLFTPSIIVKGVAAMSNKKHAAGTKAENETPEVALNSARGQKGRHLQEVAPEGGAPASAKAPPEDDFLHRTLPGRQKFAKAFLAGKAPGLQQRYAPDAKVSDVEGWVEDDETVERLVEWREEAPYG